MAGGRARETLITRITMKKSFGVAAEIDTKKIVFHFQSILCVGNSGCEDGRILSPFRRYFRYSIRIRAEETLF